MILTTLQGSKLDICLTTLQGSKLDMALPLCKAANSAKLQGSKLGKMQGSKLGMFLPLCKAANLAWSEKASSSWASAPRKSSSRMGVADAVVSTFHIVLFSGMDFVLPASRMFHQLRTSGVCTGAPHSSQGVPLITRSTTHHKEHPSSQDIPLIIRGAPRHKQYHSTQEIPLITEPIGHKVPPPGE